jgi:hypothetical protein
VVDCKIGEAKTKVTLDPAPIAHDVILGMECLPRGNAIDWKSGTIDFKKEEPTCYTVPIAIPPPANALKPVPTVPTPAITPAPAPLTITATPATPRAPRPPSLFGPPGFSDPLAFRTPWLFGQRTRRSRRYSGVFRSRSSEAGRGGW